MNVKKILENPIPWPSELTTNKNYSRIHDDHDGTFEGQLSVFFLNNGDACVTTDHGKNYLRFRNFGGGGMSLRVYNALVALALAIHLDNEQKPQK